MKRAPFSRRYGCRTVEALLYGCQDLRPRMDVNVIFIVIDGVRGLDLESRSIFPNLFELRRTGIFFPNMRVSNPVGISLPAYADILTGRRQSHILNNQRPEPGLLSPTLLHTLKNQLGLDENGVSLISSWGALEWLCEDGFHRDCGWRPGLLKPEVYPGSRSDVDTVKILFEQMRKRLPRFVFIHLGDADEEGHLHENGSEFHYRHSLRESDHHIGQIRQFLDSHPFYQNSTHLIVTTDHGRDDPQWWDHGACAAQGGELCSGCKNVFGVISGPGLKAGTVDAIHTHLDWAPTVASLFGVCMPSALGHCMLA